MYETTSFGLFWHLKRLSLWVYYKIAPHVFIIYGLVGPCETRNYLLYLVAVWWDFKNHLFVFWYSNNLHPFHKCNFEISFY